MAETVKRIVYTDHALERIAFRGISMELVSDAIRSSEVLIDAKGGRKQAIRMVDEGEVSVIYVERDTDIIVITAFWGR